MAAAYAWELLTLDDYGQKVTSIREKLSKLEQSRQQVESDYRKMQQARDRKHEVQMRLAGLRTGISSTLPDELKRDIVTILVDKIVFNSETGRVNYLWRDTTHRF